MGPLGHSIAALAAVVALPVGALALLARPAWREGLRERLMDDGGELRRFVNVYVNGEDVRFEQGLQTALSDGDEVSIVPAVAGG